MSKIMMNRIDFRIWGFIITVFLSLLTPRCSAVVSEAEGYVPCMLTPPYLRCEGLKWTSVPFVEGPVNQQNKFTYFEINYNNIRQIDQGVFNELGNNLLSLSIGQNDVSSATEFVIHNFAFQNLNQLKRLIISNKQMIVLSSQSDVGRFLFQTPNLEYLELEFFRIDAPIPEIKVPTLKEIKLVNLKLPAGFDDKIFASTTMLENLHLNLVDSPLVFSKMHVWGASLVNLKKLFLYPSQGTKSITLPPNLNNLMELTILNTDPSTIVDMTLLKSDSLIFLDLRSNKLESVSNTNFVGITNLKNIETLTLTGTQLANVPPELFYFPQLKRFSFGGDSLFTITKSSFVSNTLLEELVIVKAKMYMMINADAFIPLKNLVKLNLKNMKQIMFENQQTNWSTIFSHLPALSDLTMQSMDIDVDILRQLVVLEKLISLDLSDNKITSIPAKLFENMSLLRTVILRNNNLTQIDMNTFAGLNFERLTTLNLANNDITVMRNCSFGYAYKSSGNFLISVENNPFVCDCRILWFKKMYSSALTDNVVCNIYGPNAGIKISALQESQLTTPICPIPLPDTCGEVTATKPEANDTGFSALPSGVYLHLHDSDQTSVIAECVGCNTSPLLRIKYSNMQITYIPHPVLPNTTPKLVTKSLVAADSSILIQLKNPDLEHEYCLSLERADGKANTEKVCIIYKNKLAHPDGPTQGGLSMGVIIAIVIAIVVAVIITTVFVICCNKRRKEKELLKRRMDESNRAASMHSIQFYDENGMALDHPQILQPQGSQFGLAASRRSSVHSLYTNPHQIGGSPPAGAQGDLWLNIADNTDQVQTRYRKNKSRSMENILDAVGSTSGAPRAQRQFRKSNAWQSSENILRDNRQSSASNRLPLSLSQAYLNAGLVPPSAQGPLPLPPRESTYEEIDDDIGGHHYDKPQSLSQPQPNANTQSPGPYLPMLSNGKSIATDAYMMMQRPPDFKSQSQAPESTDSYTIPQATINPDSYQPLMQPTSSPNRPKSNEVPVAPNTKRPPDSAPETKPLPPRKPSVQSGKTSITSQNSRISKDSSEEEKPLIPARQKDRLSSMAPSIPDKPKPVATIVPNAVSKPPLQSQLSMCKPPITPKPKISISGKPPSFNRSFNDDNGDLV